MVSRARCAGWGTLALSMAIAALGCGARSPAPAVAPPVVRPAAPPGPRPGDPSPWPCAMRVLAWTDSGIGQIGELPWSPPPHALITPWYVEPTATLDRAQLVQLVNALREARIPGLSLRGQRVAAALSELRDLPDLSALVLDDPAIDGRALEALSGLGGRLVRLELSGTGIDDAAVAAVVARHPALEVIDLGDTAVGDSAAASLGALPALRDVNLAGTRLTDAGGARLGALAKLEVVDLGRTGVAGKTVAALRGLPLRGVFLGGTQIGKEIATLAALARGLRRFDASGLVGYAPSNADLAWLTGATELVELGLSGSRAGGEFVEAIARLPKLRALRLANTPLSRATILVIAARSQTAGLQPLYQLDLAGTIVDDTNAALLLSAPLMRSLRLDDTPITDAALAATEPSVGLLELHLSGTKVTDAGLVLLERVPHLTGLGLARSAIGSQTLARIAKLRALRTLVLSDIRVPVESLRDLGRLTALEGLHLDRTSADDTTVTALAALRYLRVLHLDGTSVSRDSLAILRTLVLLEDLAVGGTRMSASIANLDAWPALRTLSLAGLPIGDRDLRSVARRPTLFMLDLSATQVRDPAPLAALPALRGVRLERAPLTPAGVASAKQLAARGIDVAR